MNKPVNENDKPLILVVDDERVGRMYIERALRTEGYDVITAEHGQRAVELSAERAPNMVVMDVMMPVMDGYAACAAIREQEDHLHVPILMLTGLDDLESVEKSFDCGATDFVIKPVNLPIFKQRVRYGLKTRETDLELYKHQLRLAYAHKVARLGYWDWDIENDHLYWSDEVYTIFSVSPGQFESNHQAFQAKIHVDDREKVDFALDQSLRYGLPYSIEHRVIQANDHLQVVHQHAELIKNEAGQVIRMLGIVQDITERHVAQQKIQHLAYYDSLTDLPNRTLFYDRLSHALALSSRSDEQVAIFLIDLDRFKNINDSLGHDVGDHFLRSVAHSLKSAVRKTDTIARLGGDEFALITEGVTSKQGVMTVAEKLLKALSRTHRVQGNELISNGSIGITLSSPGNRDKDALIRQADLAMYHAKGSGGGQFSFYSGDMKSRAHQSLILEKELRQALDKNELVIYYQPKINVQTEKIMGMEALIRWQHPEKGLIPPYDFIPIAEETGLIVPIGQWVLEHACKQTVQWHQQGFKDLVLSVNVSVRQFNHQGFVDEVSNAVKNSGIDPHYLDLEITESCTMNNIETAIRLLERFRKMGIRISMDDFGTGFSSLSYLNQLPLDTLKVDRSFIKDINADGDNGELARLIIAMAKSLKLRVVAEGVETQDHLNFLKSNHCDEFQGFLISPPIPANQFEQLLTTSQNQPSTNPSPQPAAEVALLE